MTTIITSQPQDGLLTRASSFDNASIASNDTTHSKSESKSLGRLLRKTFASKKRDSAIDVIQPEEQDLLFPAAIWQKIYCQLPLGSQACLAMTCRRMQVTVGRSAFAALRTNQTERIYFLRRIDITTYIEHYFLCFNCGLFHELDKGRARSVEKCREVRDLVSQEFMSKRCVRSGGTVTLFPGCDLSWWMVQIAMNMRRGHPQRAVHLLDAKASHKDGVWKSQFTAKVYKGKLYLKVKTYTSFSACKQPPHGFPTCPHVNSAKLNAAVDNAWLACRSTGGDRRESTISLGGLSISIGGGDKGRRDSQWAPMPSMAEMEPMGRRGSVMQGNMRRQSAWQLPQTPDMSRRGSTIAGLPDMSRRGSVMPSMPEMGRRGSVMPMTPDMSRRGSVMDTSRRGSTASSLDAATPENPARMHIGSLHRCQHCPSEYIVEAHLVSTVEKGKYQVAVIRYIDVGEGLSPFEDYWPDLSALSAVRRVHDKSKAFQMGPRPFDVGLHRCIMARYENTKNNNMVIALD